MATRVEIEVAYPTKYKDATKKNKVSGLGVLLKK
jgi:hypothetical protein